MVKSGQNVYLQLKTDNSIHYSGIKISFIVASGSRKLLLRSYFILFFLITDEFVKHGGRERNGAGNVLAPQTYIFIIRKL